MLEKRGFRLYTKTLGGGMLIFACLVALGFATTATAAKKPCKDDQGSPHCHIGIHAMKDGFAPLNPNYNPDEPIQADRGAIPWDRVIPWTTRVIIFEDGTATHTDEGEVPGDTLDGWLEGTFDASHYEISSPTMFPDFRDRPAVVCAAIHDEIFEADGHSDSITSGDIFIDVHKHRHDGEGNGVPTDGTQPPDNGGNIDAKQRDDHWHTLEVQCFIGSSGKKNGGGGKGGGRNK